jgi:hypothetical protein
MSDDIVATILREIQSDLTRMKRDIAALKQQGAANARAVSLLHQDVRMIRPAVNDIARIHVSTCWNA